MSRTHLRRFGVAFVLWVLTVPAAAQTTTTPAPETDPRVVGPLALRDCIAIALENNLGLRIARLDRAATRTTITEAYGAFWPVIGLSAERTNLHFYGELPDKTLHLRNGHAEVTQLLPFGTRFFVGYDVFHSRLDPDRHDTPGQLLSFGLTQPLLRGGWWRTNTAGVRGARYDSRISEAGLENARLSVVQRTKTAYLEIIRQAKLVDVNSKAVERDQQLVLQSQSKLDAGLGTKRDVLSAEIVLEQDRGTLVDAQTGYAEALDQLARVMGLMPGSQPIEIVDHDVSLDSVTIQEDAWVQRALSDNPTIQAAQLAVDRTELDMQVAGNGRLPQLDLIANYNALDDPDLNEPIKNENRLRIREGKEPKEGDYTANKGWQTLLVFSYPLGNRSLRAVYSRARLVHQQAIRGYEDTQRQVTLEVRSATRALQNNVERLAILRKNIEGARSKLDFAAVNFQLGRASNLDVTDAQKDLLDAETDYINEVIDYQVQLATIEALIGGSLN